jgi:hypothetical protein
MTAIHRREMLGLMLGGAAVAAAGSSMIPAPAEAAPYCPANRVPNWSPAVPPGVRRRKQCWSWEGRRRRRRFCCWRWLTPHGNVRLSPIAD